MVLGGSLHWIFQGRLVSNTVNTETESFVYLNIGQNLHTLHILFAYKFTKIIRK